MQHTFKTAEANEMIAAAQDYLKAQERVFNAVTNYYGEQHPMTAQAAKWTAESNAGLEPILGSLLLAEMQYKGAVTNK